MFSEFTDLQQNITLETSENEKYTQVAISRTEFRSPFAVFDSSESKVQKQLIKDSKDNESVTNTTTVSKKSNHPRFAYPSMHRKIHRSLITTVDFLEDRPSDISPLGFNYSSYYRVNNSQPLVIDLPKTRWNTGNYKFQSFMNDYFIPFQQANSATFPNKTIYLKRGTTGIAGQMSGMCDVLLLSILNNRTFHYHAPAILPHFFDFPLFNISYPVRLDNNTEAERLYNRGMNIRETTDYFVEYVNNPLKHMSIFGDGDLNAAYPGSLVICSLHTFAKYLFRSKGVVQRMASFQEGLPYAEKVMEPNWYSVCARGLFQPSAYLQRFIDPYLQLFKGHRVLGVHVRSGGQAKWKDAGYFKLTPYMVKRHSRKIHDLMRDSRLDLLFLSTDSDLIESQLRQRFGSVMITVKSFPREHVGKDPTESGLIRSLLDLFLLGQCDELLLTKRSGFSQTALALNGKNPPVSYFAVKYK